MTGSEGLVTEFKTSTKSMIQGKAMDKVVFKFLFGFAVVGFALATSLKADQHSDALKNYLADDVVAVAYLDLEGLDPVAIADLLGALGVEGAELDNVKAATLQAENERKKLTEAGLHYVYILLKTSDLNEMGTSWVMPVVKGKNVRDAKNAMGAWVDKTNLSGLIKELQAGDDVVLAAGNAGQLKRLAEDQPNQVRDLTAAWDSLGSGTVGLVVFGDPDSRRVVRGLFPNMPAPFAAITGKQVADDLNWGGVEIGLPPSLQMKLEIEAANPETASAVAKAIESAVGTLAMLPQFQSVAPDKQTQKLFLDALTPKVKQNRISVSLDSVTGDMDRLTKIIAGPIQELRTAARMQSEMNNLRQLVLAMHNYVSAFKKFPNPAGKTQRTPAGLSWRVQILPFIEQGELYEQFHLDEPWDSEHNLKLVTKMPEIFKSPLLPAAKIHQEGKTIYQVPVSVEGMFKPDDDGSEGVTFGDITDGSSNTILMVTVAESEAAIWTKPDDWEVDLRDPWKGLKGGKRESVVVNFADGSVHVLPVEITADQLRALITAAGGEVIDFRF